MDVTQEISKEKKQNKSYAHKNKNILLPFKVILFFKKLFNINEDNI